MPENLHALAVPRPGTARAPALWGSDTEMLSAALAYASAGLPVFPCGVDKKPLIAAWPSMASTDEVQVREWWTRWPKAMIGLPTGRRSELYVVDIDVKDGVDGMPPTGPWPSLWPRSQSGRPRVAGTPISAGPATGGGTQRRRWDLASTRAARAATSSRRPARMTTGLTTG